MSKTLTLNDINEKIRSMVYTQSYSKQITIDGVKVIEINNITSEDGDFAEILRINDKGFSEEFPQFKLAQINRSRMLPKTIKAWHLHFKQDEIWFVPPEYRLMTGLWDTRKESITTNKTMKIVLGGGKSFLLYIPKGVAHGSANMLYESAIVFYFTDHRFNPKNPDEQRIKWDALGKDFWLPSKD